MTKWISENLITSSIGTLALAWCYKSLVRNWVALVYQRWDPSSNLRAFPSTLYNTTLPSLTIVLDTLNISWLTIVSLLIIRVIYKKPLMPQLFKLCMVNLRINCFVVIIMIMKVKVCVDTHISFGWQRWGIQSKVLPQGSSRERDYGPLKMDA